MSASTAAEGNAPRRGRIRSWARLARAYFSCNLQAAMEYRANFLLQVFGMMLNNASFVVFWKVLIGKAGTVAGYGFADVMFFWALSSAGFGLAFIVFGNVRFIGKAIVTGELDLWLLQPRDALLSASMSRMVVSAWGDLFYGLILMALTQGADPLRWLLFLALTAANAIIFAASLSIFESLSFFLGNARGVADAGFELLLSTSLYPDRIFGHEVRWILYSLIPAGFMVFIPLKAFRALSPLWAAASFGAAVGYGILAWLIFQLGLKRYESGNMMGART